MGVKTNKTLDSFTLLLKNNDRVLLLHCRQRTVCPLPAERACASEQLGSISPYAFSLPSSEGATD